MIKKKTNYAVETVAKCLTDSATDEAGVVAFRTFRSEEVEISNDYHIPFHAICAVKVSTSIEEVEVEDETCQEPSVPKPHIDGADNTSIRQGTEFDLTEGVKAYDGDGNEIPFTVEPSEVDSCEVGDQTFIYSAEGVTKERVITVTQIADPTINGISQPIEVEVGEEFDPLDGVTAVDGNGNDIAVTVEQIEPTTNIIVDEDVVLHISEPVPVSQISDAEIGKRYRVTLSNILVDGYEFPDISDVTTAREYDDAPYVSIILWNDGEHGYNGCSIGVQSLNTPNALAVIETEGGEHGDFVELTCHLLIEEIE